MSEERVKGGFSIAVWLGAIIFVVMTVFASGTNYQRINENERQIGFLKQDVKSLQDIDTKVAILNSLIPTLKEQINELKAELKRARK